MKLTAMLCGLLALFVIGAGKKISDYTETLELTDAWIYEIAVPGVTNYKVTFGTIVTNILARGGGGDVTTAQLNISSNVIVSLSAGSNKVSNLLGQSTNLTMWGGATNQGNLYIVGNTIPSASNTWDQGSFLLPLRTNWMNSQVTKSNAIVLGRVNIGTNTLPRSPLEITENGLKYFHQDLSNQAVFIGQMAGQNWPYLVASDTHGSVGIGYQALKYNTNGDNTAVGGNVLANLNNGLYNTAMGADSMTLTTSGESSSAYGKASLYNNLTGQRNTAIGAFSLYSNLSSNNTALGASSAYGNTVGLYNVALGDFALYLNQTGSQNTAVGGGSPLRFSTGSDNVGFGASAGYGLMSGSRNLFLHSNAGTRPTTGSDNMVMGYGVDLPNSTSSNMFTIGNLIYGMNVTSAPGTNVSTGNVGIGTNAPTEKLEVLGNMRVFGNISIPEVGYSYYMGTNARLYSDSGYVLLKDLDGTTRYSFEKTSSGANSYYDLGAGADAGTMHHFRSAAGAATLMTIRNGGNVGIGTNALEARLQVTADNVWLDVIQIGTTNKPLMMTLDTNGTLTLPNLSSNASPVAFLATDAAGAVYETAVPSGGGGSTQMVAAAIGTLTLTNALSVDTLNVNTLFLTNGSRMFVQTNTVIVTNTATTSALLDGQGVTNIAANRLVVGNTVRIRLFGIYFTPGAPAGTTLTLRVLLNGTVAAQSVVAQPPGGMVGQSWDMTWDAVVRATGASGILMPGGMLTFGRGAATTSDVQGMPRTVTTTIDTTAAITVSVDATFNNTTDADAIHCQGGTIEIIP